MTELTRWQREQLARIESTRTMLEAWPPLLARPLRLELDRLSVSARNNLAQPLKRDVGRRIRQLRDAVFHMLPLTPAERVPGHQLAYSGEALPQRGELTPLMRDIVCRAITHEISSLSETYDGPGVPEFLRGIQPDANGVERTLLRQARLLLSPRSDDEQALADAIAHDARVGLG